MSRPYISDFWNLCEMIRDCEEKYTSDEVYFGIRFMQISAFSAGNGILSFENNINNFRVCYTKSSKGIPIKDGTINHRQTRQDWISRSQWTRGDQRPHWRPFDQPIFHTLMIWLRLKWDRIGHKRTINIICKYGHVMLCQNRFPWSSRFQYLGTINFQNAKNQKRNPLNGKGRLEISSDLK